MTDQMDIDSSTTIKRKADVPSNEPHAPQRIRPLAIDVVNRIAAGEIIVSPVNALKEMVENSVDAGATRIDVLVKDGGLKLLQITDNGCGISKEDLPILCVRHTTSKLSDFKDLESITSYGFRGEALASISHIAHLSVLTRTADSELAWKAHYQDGKLVPARPGLPAEPKKVPGNTGTQFTIEDMFFNVPIRRKAFRSPGEEYNKIIDMLGRYAIHCESVGFSCKKSGEASVSLSIQANATVVDRIRQIYGRSIANELISFDMSNEKYGFNAEGLITNANYHTKKTTLLLFVNHRCVESNNIRKALEQLYSTFLPKHGRPFIYLSLQIRPDHVDVNLHPTKRVVGLVHEDEITQLICEHISDKLGKVDESRTFVTQQLIPASGSRGLDVETESQPGPEPKRQRRNSNTLVRTDATSQKITALFSADSAESDTPGQGFMHSAPEAIDYELSNKENQTCTLASVKQLKREVMERQHDELTDVFANHIFVGIVDEDKRLAAIQGGQKLYLIDYGHACYEYCYQLGLTDFGNFGVVTFKPPLDIRELVTIAADCDDTLTAAEKEKNIETARETLIFYREMLEDYFSLEVSPSGELLTLPLMIKGYTPPMVKLPQFLLCVGLKVNWKEEKACFESFLRELAKFYAPEQLPPTPGNEQLACEEKIPEEMKVRRMNVRWAVEHIFFPAFKSRLVATKELATGALWEAANLKQMYRVFERC